MAKRPFVYGGVGKLPDSEAFKGRSGKTGVLFRASYTERELKTTNIPYKEFIFIPFKKFRRIK